MRMKTKIQFELCFAFFFALFLDVLPLHIAHTSRWLSQSVSHRLHRTKILQIKAIYTYKTKTL